MTTTPSSSSTAHQETLGQGGGEGTIQEEADVSPPRCEWEFRLAAAAPSPAPPRASDVIGSVDFDPLGRLLATGGIARKIRIYSLSSLLSPPAAAAGGAAVSCICVPAKLSSVRWRPDAGGRVVGCGDYDGVVTEYDAERGVATAERDEHGGRRVWALDYAAGGSMAASGSDDRTAHVWDPRAPAAGSGCGAAGWATAAAGGAVLCVEFDPAGGPHLAVGSADRRACVYDVRAMARGPVGTMDGHVRPVTYVRFARGAGRVVTSAADGTHRLWEWGRGSTDADMWGLGREVRAYRGHVSGRSFVGMGVWRHGGLIANGSESNELFVYDLRWGTPIWVHGFGGDGLRAPTNASLEQDFVSAVTWWQGGGGEAGDGGGMLAVGGSDGTLRLFTCQRREESAECME